MGSKSRSSTSSTQNTTDVTTSLADNRIAEAGGNIGGNVTIGQAGGAVSVEMTDMGAIGHALDFAGDAFADGLDFSRDVAFKSMDIANTATMGAIDRVSDDNKWALQQQTQAVENALSFARSATRSEAGQTVENLTKMLTITAAVVGVAYALRGSK